MADVFDIEKRSEIMRAVKSSNNKSTELKLIEIFKKNKIIGWRRNSKLKGKPDFIFPKLKIAIFTDGCFWHGHNCRNLTPKQNSEYWQKKIARNIERDREAGEYLKRLGWKVVRIWECRFKKNEIENLTKELITILK